MHPTDLTAPLPESSLPPPPPRPDRRWRGWRFVRWIHIAALLVAIPAGIVLGLEGAAGILFLFELTRDYELILPMMVSCVAAGLTAKALARVTSGPAAVLRGLSPALAGLGQLGVGALADLCLVDLEAEWLVTPGALQSHSRHTPFAGMMLPGRVRATLVSGRPAWETPV